MLLNMFGWSETQKASIELGNENFTQKKIKKEEQKRLQYKKNKTRPPKIRIRITKYDFLFLCYRLVDTHKYIKGT